MSKKQNILYYWKFEDKKNRSPLWYMIALSIAIGLIVWGFITRQYGMSIVIMLIVGFFYFLENNAEDEIQVEITDLGVRIQNIFYDYSRISSYSIIYNWNQAIYLRLHLKKRGITFVNLHIDNTIAWEVRTILPNFIEENAKQEITFLEKLTHFLKL